jgi:hypothetical protein
VVEPEQHSRSSARDSCRTRSVRRSLGIAVLVAHLVPCTPQVTSPNNGSDCIARWRHNLSMVDGKVQSYAYGRGRCSRMTAAMQASKQVCRVDTARHEWVFQLRLPEPFQKELATQSSPRIQRWSKSKGLSLSQKVSSSTYTRTQALSSHLDAMNP